MYISKLDPPYLRGRKCCLGCVTLALDNSNGNIDITSLAKGFNHQLCLLAHIMTLMGSLKLGQNIDSRL